MFGYASSKASSVAWRASPSAPVDCHPDRMTVPVTLCGSHELDGGAAGEPLVVGLSAPPGLAAPPLDGAGVAPLLQAAKIRIEIAAVVTARQGRRMCLLHAVCQPAAHVEPPEGRTRDDDGR